MRRFLIIVGKILLSVFSVAILLSLAFVGWFVWHAEYGIGVPDVRKLAEISATGPACSRDDQRTYLALGGIPPLVRQAVVAIEQPDFYEFPVDPVIELAAAAFHHRPPRPAGISMAVTRCLISLSPECCRNLDRHVGNVVLMRRVERALTRDRILEIYLNESYVGRGRHGVHAASTTYLGKRLADLSIDEVALVVSLLRSGRLRPNREAEQRNFVIDRLLQAGIITADQAAAAKDRPVVLKKPPDNATEKL